MGSRPHFRRRSARRIVAAIALVAVLAAGGAVAVASPKPASLRPVGDSRDLDLDSVTSIYQDRRGFMWIGTREGLVMYDGYTAVRFEHETTDITSLSDNVVRTIYEDRDGNLWLGTNSGGLERFDRSSATFEHHRHDSSDPTSLSHDSVNTVLHDREGTLWVGTQIGLNRMDAASDRFERIGIGTLPGEIENGYVYHLHEDRVCLLYTSPSPRDS